MAKSKPKKSKKSSPKPAQKKAASKKEPTSNSFGTLMSLSVGGKSYQYHSLKKLAKGDNAKKLAKLPFSLKILVENLLRQEDGVVVKRKDIENLLNWNAKAEPEHEIQFMPARVLLQDFTGVPAVADLAAMRGALKRMGGKPSKINPLQPADLVIDHSVQVDMYGTSLALQQNADLEFERNKERYEFLRWGQNAFKDFRVVPPDTGIVHQVNLEFLASVAMTRKVNGKMWVYPDTLVGTDSHTTMINGLGCLGWGVGGIEAEAALLGQPCSMLIPHVVGFKLTGKMAAGTTATDLVLTVTQMLRKKGVVGKFVEFYGPGLKELSLADRATIANMAPEYGATAGLFPVDAVTTDYLKLTGRGDLVKLVEGYYKAQGLWYEAGKSSEPTYSDTLDLDLGTVEPSLAGPARPQDRVVLGKVRESFRKSLLTLFASDVSKLDKGAVDAWAAATPTGGVAPELQMIEPNAKLGKLEKSVSVKTPEGARFQLSNGSVVIAAITSCTNTSNPSVLMAAGLLARNAVKRGLIVKPWVKTSLAPGSKVVTDYLIEAGLMPYLEALRFHTVGYGCTTCIGNSGPLPDHISNAITEGDLAVASVLSGNRNFEGRVNTQVKANYLASPPLVVAYALAGNVNMDLTKDPLGYDSSGAAVYLKDIWPTNAEVAATVQKFVTEAQFKKSYADVFAGDKNWSSMKVPSGELYQWDSKSTYIKEPPFFDGLKAQPDPVKEIKKARVLALLGDSITTDHISPAGSFGEKTPAGIYLKSLGVEKKDFNSYGARRGNHEVMVRGTFANVRLKNQMVPGVEGGVTIHVPTSTQMSIYDASMKYQAEGCSLMIIAGKEYGTGSSRDWAAKGPKLLGIRAVIAESFERIHRSNLVGMGILPLQFINGESAATHGIKGTETFDIEGMENLSPGQKITVKMKSADGKEKTFTALSRIDTPNEIEYFKNGGILPYVLRQQV
ncbi:MAG: aconitate hydratase AcnA [Bdellovibrionales bacterium]|nr:aconitate hydratase AcnA [Bdellovibrionales bacterium]